jgi:hypothetical protein
VAHCSGWDECGGGAARTVQRFSPQLLFDCSGNCCRRSAGCKMDASESVLLQQRWRKELVGGGVTAQFLKEFNTEGVKVDISHAYVLLSCWICSAEVIRL